MKTQEKYLKKREVKNLLDLKFREINLLTQEGILIEQNGKISLSSLIAYCQQQVIDRVTRSHANPIRRDHVIKQLKLNLKKLKNMKNQSNVGTKADPSYIFWLIVIFVTLWFFLF